jgi:hypothetical protein
VVQRGFDIAVVILAQDAAQRDQSDRKEREIEEGRRGCA